MHIVLLIIALMLATPGMAQQQTMRDASGRIIGTVSTDSNGQRTWRDGNGRITGTATTDSNGTTTYRDATGSISGTANKAQRR